ncbi:oxygen-independent coproporphyrinogen III oxidase [Sesbania bispinosa]|nr:oxygen-independent coproporphyrinogen III oxidase [Sesbania bispinosa]
MPLHYLKKQELKKWVRDEPVPIKSVQHHIHPNRDGDRPDDDDEAIQRRCSLRVDEGLIEVEENGLPVEERGWKEWREVAVVFE